MALFPGGMSSSSELAALWTARTFADTLESFLKPPTFKVNFGLTIGLSGERSESA
jgi:hypothetical protein